MLRKVFAFLKKEFLYESSYKFAFLSNALGIVVSLLGYFFIDAMFGHRIAPNLEEFGVNYFPYVLLSSALFGYVGAGLGSFSECLRVEQTEGTLEVILLTPTTISTILFSMVLWNLIFATLHLAIYLLLAIFAFGVDFSNINILSTITIFMLTILSFSGLGILSASFIMVFKRGNPAGWLISGLEGLIGGVYFPVAVLPGWMQVVAQFFPITYAIRAIQLAVYKGYPLMRLSREAGILLLFSVILLPLGLAFFEYSVKRARAAGSLSQY